MRVINIKVPFGYTATSIYQPIRFYPMKQQFFELLGTTLLIITIILFLIYLTTPPAWNEFFQAIMITTGSLSITSFIIATTIIVYKLFNNPNDRIDQ